MIRPLIVFVYLLRLKKEIETAMLFDTRFKPNGSRRKTDSHYNR